VGSRGHEAVHNAIFIMPVTEQVLAAQQHLQPGIGHEFPEGPQAFPGVFVQEADARVECGAAPAFHAPESGLVNVLAGRNHVFQGHASGQEALVGVSQNQFCNFNRSWHRQILWRVLLGAEGGASYLPANCAWLALRKTIITSASGPTWQNPAFGQENEHEEYLRQAETSHLSP